MSPKSRNRARKQHTSGIPAIELLEPQRGAVHRLTGELHDTAEAIITGRALLARQPDPVDLSDDQIEELLQVHAELDGPDDEPVDPAAAGNAVTAMVALTTRVLARSLLARTLGREPVPPVPNDESDADEGLAPHILDDLAAKLQPNVPDDITLSSAERRAAVDDAGHLLREVGLEEFDVSCRLIAGRDGSFDLETVPLPSPSAHVGLLELLFERAENVVSTDLLLTAERAASSWAFSCWSAAPQAGGLPPEIAAFAQQVREQEYSLARRPMITAGGSIIGAVVTDEVFADLYPRQHRMAQALVNSFVGVFECVGRVGHRSTFRSVRDGQTFDVHEHMDPCPYAAGWLCLGRLLPLDKTMYVRSPGMIFGSPPNASIAAGAAVKAFDELCATLPPDLALEGVIASMVFGVRVPREVKPARSKAEAAELLAELLDLVIQAPETDETLNDYIDALAEQADSGWGVQQPAKRPSRSKSKQKSKQKSKRRR